MKRVTTGRTGLLAICGLLAAACDYEDSTKRPTSGLKTGVEAPVGLASALAFVEPATGTVFMVDGVGGKPRVRPLEVGRSPVAWAAQPARDQLLVLTQGHKGGGGIEAENPALWVVPAAPGAAPQALLLPGRFNALSLSPDGRFAIAFFRSANGAGIAGDSFFNPNLMAIVDFNKVPLQAVARSLRPLGSVPMDFDYSPAMGAPTLPDGDRRLVVVHSRNYVTLMDLDHLERPEITVPLTLPEDNRSLTPAQIKFDIADPTIYVRVNGASDVFALRLEPLAAAERAANGNDYRPSLGQLAAGAGPRDMEIYAGETGTRLLVVGDGREVTIIDARSSRSLSVPLDHSAGQVLRYEGAAPGEADVKPRALLVGKSGETRLTFVDLARFEELKTRNLDVKIMAGPVQSFQAFPNQSLALIEHGGGAGASVVDLVKRTVTPLAANISIARLRTFATQPNRVWILPQREALLGFLDLGTLAIGEVRLDAPVSDLWVAAQAGPGSLLVVHPGREGYVSALDSALPVRESAHSLRGFAAANLLDRSERSLP